MNRLLLLVVLFISSTCFAQKSSLRDSLFSGKLKADSALVAKSKVNEEKVKEDSIKKVQIDSLRKIGADTTQITGVITTTPIKPELKYSDNNKTWKKFTDEYTKIVTAEMANTKKNKKGGYTVS